MTTVREEIRKTVSIAQHEALDLTPEQLLEMYEYMHLARACDERANILYRQGKIAFTVTGIGQEAAQIGATWALDRTQDYTIPYYRDTSVVLALGMTARELMLAEFGRAEDPNSGGRQMPKHWGAKHLNIITNSSPVATQIPHAAGLGLAIKLQKKSGVVWVSFGDGAVSRGDFHEGLNFAAIHKLPVILFCENNLYAISVPFEKQSPVPNVADRASAYGIPGIVVDGSDILETYRVTKEAVERARNGEGPTLIEAKTYRFDPHTTNDDDRKYRSPDEVEQWRQRDPIVLFEEYLLEHNIITKEKSEEIAAWAKQEAMEAAQYAEAAAPPNGPSALRNVYAEEVEHAWR